MLNGRREAQELVLRLLGGEEIPLQRTNEAQSYLLDAGLIIPTGSLVTEAFLLALENKVE